MRILACTPAYPPRSLVGAWLATHRYLAGLVERGHEVNVVTYLMDGWAYDLDGVHVHPKADLGHFSRSDVYLSHLGDNNLLARLARVLQIPHVRMLHGSDGLNLRRLQRHPPDLLVANSSTLQGETAWHGETIVCRPLIDIDPAPGPRDHVTLVNLATAKGGPVLQEIARRSPDRSFLGVLGGYGDQVLDHPGNVEVHPPTHQMAAKIYARTRVLLMPSERETWGMVGVEAMACGIPVIAHPTPGLEESLGDAGIFCDRDDPDAWVEQISRLDDPDEYEQASQAALRRSAELDPTPDLERFTDALEALCSS